MGRKTNTSLPSGEEVQHLLPETRIPETSQSLPRPEQTVVPGNIHHWFVSLSKNTAQTELVRFSTPRCPIRINLETKGQLLCWLAPALVPE